MLKLEFRELRGELVRIEILDASSFVPHLMAYNLQSLSRSAGVSQVSANNTI